jgi:hypothetical protein
MDIISISQILFLCVSTILAIIFMAETIGERIRRRNERKRNQEREDRINKL